MDNLTKRIVFAVLSREKSNLEAATKVAVKMMRGKKIVDLPEAEYDKLFQDNIANALIDLDNIRLKAARAVKPSLTRGFEDVNLNTNESNQSQSTGGTNG